MDMSQVTPEVVELLSRITGQSFRKQDITPPVIFVAALVMLMVEVVFADGKVTEDEKKRLQVTLNSLKLPNEEFRQLVKLLLKGIQKQKLVDGVEILTLASPLSAAERVLLMAFGYQISLADGEMDISEKRYLEKIAGLMQVDSRHLEVLESSFTHQPILDDQALEEVHYILDPGRFQSLDLVFVTAASHILKSLPSKPKRQVNQRFKVTAYNELKKFKEYYKQLDTFCYELFQITQCCVDQGLLDRSLSPKITKISQQLQSKTFRVAIVGEFSRGKSTLLNALLGEEIQPVREIPCTGTITRLRYGSQRRVICCYKDGQTEEIPLEQYHNKVTISEEAAINNISDELSRSNIAEIIFENPDLELCKSGVEIIDSPGLNEHPERDSITQKLLIDTDAVIFLTNANQQLTYSERQLLSDIRFELNGGLRDQPAQNLFVVVNFWDLVTPKGRDLVQQRVQNLVQGDHPIIDGSNRIHFISAQSALEAFLNGTQNEYTESLSQFVISLEGFLSKEPGKIKISRAVTNLQILIEKYLEEIAQLNAILAQSIQDIKISEDTIQEILQKIGEASGRDIKIYNFVAFRTDKIIEKVKESWDLWVNNLKETLRKKIEKWSSEHSPIWSRDQLVQDYLQEFKRDLSSELNDWIENQLKKRVLAPYLQEIDSYINMELQAIQSNFKQINNLIDYETSDSKNLLSTLDYNVSQDSSFFGKIGLAGLGAAVLIPAIIFPIGLILTIIGSLIGGGLALGGIGGVFSIDQEIKAKVFEAGWEQFVKSSDTIFATIDNIISRSLSARVQWADERITEMMSFYERLLEQQDTTETKTIEQYQKDKVFIQEKRHQLEKLRDRLKSLMNELEI